MMDTVLNLGLNDKSIHGLIKQTENPRFAWDSYRRFIQMFSNVVMGLDGDLFENAINIMKRDRGVESDTDLTAEDLEQLVEVFKGIFTDNVSAEEYPSLVVDGKVQFLKIQTFNFAWLSRQYLALGIILVQSCIVSRTRFLMIWALQ